ncbi:MAG TPA: MoxR family ATPase [Candidatus Thermoplasmatota archaeon]|nr:MoxR family ATPase [Candidatus Thermoplasmatota archaeon]
MALTATLKKPSPARAAAPPNAAGPDAKTQADVRQLQATCQKLVDEVGKVIVGKKEVLRLIMVNILSQGNILFEDYPGLAKTVMASTFARASGCDFKRVQFTPDVLPADITGAMVYDQKASQFQFRPGPVFTNILLADEINRAPPKTQSSLLEAMAERQVSIEGTTHKLAAPYIVMATQNPIEQEGTYPLPEAQMDRFLMKLSVGYPDKEEEKEIGRRRIRRGKDEFDVAQVASAEAMVSMQQTIERLHFGEAVLDYVARLIVATRHHPAVQVGASPRGTLALIKASRASAALSGRAFVTPDDVRRICGPVLAHRIILKPDARFGGTTNGKVIDEIVAKTAAPTV